MNIHLVNRFFDFSNAGLGRVALSLRDGLKLKGHNVTTTSADAKSLYKYAMFTYLTGRFSIPDNKDIYHSITPVESQVISVEKNLVTTICDLIPLTNPASMGAGTSNRFNKFLAIQSFKLGVDYAVNNSKAISVISRKTYDDLMNYAGSKLIKRKVIPSIITLGIREDLKPLHIKHNRLTFGYIGQLDKRKRVHLIIEAFVRDNPDAILLIAGQGNEEENLRRLASSNNNIIFLGFVQDEHLNDFYNSIDVFLFPSASEGYGLPIVEALACGKPVFIDAKADIPSEVKLYCNLFYDGFSFTKAQLEDIRCFGSVVHDRHIKWAQEHSWKKVIDEYEKVYNSILH